MEARRALAILEALAEGVDPRTGEVLGEGSPMESAEVVRALYAAMEALEEKMRVRTKAGGGAANAGRPWTADDDGRLGRMFDEGLGVAEMAREFGRTKLAIASRLVRLGRGPDQEWAMRVSREESVGVATGTGRAGD